MSARDQGEPTREPVPPMSADEARMLGEALVALTHLEERAHGRSYTSTARDVAHQATLAEAAKATKAALVNLFIIAEVRLDSDYARAARDAAGRVLAEEAGVSE